MFNQKVINEMFHYMKAGKNVISSDIQWFLDRADKLCPFLHGKKTDLSCYVSNPEIENLISYINRYALCYEFLDVDIYNLKQIKEIITDIERPENNKTLDQFKDNLSDILDFIKSNEKNEQKEGSALDIGHFIE